MSLELSVNGIQSDFQMEIGRFLTIMTSSASHSKITVEYFKIIVEPAIKHQQYKIVFDDRGNPLAYVIWAALADDVHKRAISGAPWSLHVSEWNEGPNFWVLDFISPRGYVRPIISFLKKEMGLDSLEICYRRVRNGRLMAKKLEI